MSANHKNKEEEVINRHCNDCLERKSEERRCVERRDRERKERQRKRGETEKERKRKGKGFLVNDN